MDRADDPGAGGKGRAIGPPHPVVETNRRSGGPLAARGAVLEDEITVHNAFFDRRFKGDKI